MSELQQGNGTTGSTSQTVAPYYPRGLDVRAVLVKAGWTCERITKSAHWVEAYLAVLCEQLKWRGVRRDEYGQVWYVYIGTWVPRRLHADIRSALASAGVIEYTDFRPPHVDDRIKGQCRSYRFTPAYRSLRWLPKVIESSELVRLRGRPSADWERHKQLEASRLQPHHHALRHLAEQIVLVGKGARSAAPIVRYLTDGCGRWFKVDWQNRVYHPVVACNRSLRRHLRIRGQEGQVLWTADVRAAQLQLLALVLADRFTPHPDDYRGEIAGPPYRTRGQEEKEIVEIAAHCSSICKNDAFRILQLIESGGDPYAEVLAVMNRGLPAGTGISRSEAKKAILCVLFGRPGAMEHQDAGKAIQEVYPGLFAAVQYAASRLKPGALSRILQRAESRIMIGRVAKRLLQEMPGVVFATMHDGLLGQKQHVRRFKEVIVEEWVAEVGATPFVKVEATGNADTDTPPSTAIIQDQRAKQKRRANGRRRRGEKAG